MAPTSTQQRELVLAEKDFEIQYNGQAQILRSQATFSLDRAAQVLIKTTQPTDVEPRNPLLDEDYRIRLVPGASPVEFLAVSVPIVSDATDSASSGMYFHLTPKETPVFLDSSDRLTLMEFAVVNFGRFNTQQPGEPGMRKDRLTMNANGWIVELIPVHELNLPDLSQCEGWAYKATHAARVRRRDEDFSCLSAHDFLEALTDFFSFARGRWVAPALVKGFDTAGVVIMEEWGSRSIEPYTQCATWLERNNAQVLSEVFPGFLKKWNDPTWNNTIRTAIYWYTRTCGMSAGADGSIVLIQAALERLAWVMLVQQRKSVSQDGFAKLPAADQIRLLLDCLSIPLEVPVDLEGLIAAAKKHNWQDGANAFVWIRNSIVHPSDSKRHAEMPVFEGCLLGQWYLELVLLRLFEFNGKYSNRTRKIQYVNQVESVPWATSV